MFPVHQDHSGATPAGASHPAFFLTLDDTELLAEVYRLVARERLATADLIAALMEVDRRRLYLGEGCSSLYTYCTQILHLSEHAAYGRIQAARAAAKYPAILPLLMEGSVSLTTIVLLAPHLTPENHESLLTAMRYKSKRHVELLIARMYPQPDIPCCIRMVSEPGSCAGLTTQFTSQANGDDSSHESSRSAEARNTSLALQGQASRSALSPSAVVSPLSTERYRVQMTIGRDALDQLRAVQDLLRHTIPSGDVSAIFERALALLHGELMRKKTAATDRPRRTAASPQESDADAQAPPRAEKANSMADEASPESREERPAGGASRYIPAAVRRQVWARDQGQCAFVGSQGRCVETGFLEFHHLLPYAAGGEPSVDNIELRCRPHNVYEAERYFGQTEPDVAKESRAIYAAAPWNSVRTECTSTSP
jgi:hypothetical protein